MPAEKCCNCAQLVSTKLSDCPHCGVERPFDKEFHDVKKREREKNNDIKRKEAFGFEKTFDPRESREEVLRDTAYVCEDCETESRWVDVVGKNCPTCGNPSTVKCTHPAKCEKLAVDIKKVDGTWYALCAEHIESGTEKCSSCGELSFSLVSQRVHNQTEYRVHDNEYICEYILQNKSRPMSRAPNKDRTLSGASCSTCGSKLIDGMCATCKSSESNENEKKNDKVTETKNSLLAIRDCIIRPRKYWVDIKQNYLVEYYNVLGGMALLYSLAVVGQIIRFIVGHIASERSFSISCLFLYLSYNLSRDAILFVFLIVGYKLYLIERKEFEVKQIAVIVSGIIIPAYFCQLLLHFLPGAILKCLLALVALFFCVRSAKHGHITYLNDEENASIIAIVFGVIFITALVVSDIYIWMKIVENIARYSCW